jgi:endonuclease NucS-like protein
MPIFRIDGQKARQLGLKRDGFGSEFELRDFFADNLEEVLGVRFLEKEYSTTDGRIDTLGIDENDSPVIIEYKWKENEEVFAQGLFYLKWLLQNKRHFELLARSKFGDKTKVNWDQPRVVLIARGFSRYVKAAVQTVVNVELKTYTLYEAPSFILRTNIVRSRKSQQAAGRGAWLCRPEWTPPFTT